VFRIFEHLGIADAVTARALARLVGYVASVLIALGAAPDGVTAQVTTRDDTPAPHDAPESGRPTPRFAPVGLLAPDELSRRLHNASESAGIFESGPISLAYPAWKRLNDRLENATGLRLGLAYTALYQSATGGPGLREAAAGDFDFLARLGTWTMSIFTESGEPIALSRRLVCRQDVIVYAHRDARAPLGVITVVDETGAAVSPATCEAAPNLSWFTMSA